MNIENGKIKIKGNTFEFKDAIISVGSDCITVGNSCIYYNDVEENISGKKNS